MKWDSKIGKFLAVFLKDEQSAGAGTLSIVRLLETTVGAVVFRLSAKWGKQAWVTAGQRIREAHQSQRRKSVFLKKSVLLSSTLHLDCNDHHPRTRRPHSVHDLRLGIPALPHQSGEKGPQQGRTPRGDHLAHRF